MLTLKISKDVLVALILVYDAEMGKKGASPLPMKHLTGEDGIRGMENLEKLMENRKSLRRKFLKYNEMVCNYDMPDLDTFAFDFIFERVDDARNKYRDAMISKGAAYAYDNYNNISIAEEIAYFFHEFGENSLGDDRAMANIIDCALRDGFFEELFDYAKEKDNFDITNTGTSGDEIADYCEKKLQEQKEKSDTQQEGAVDG
jgi:hypothetical protein